jgi:hypothetical protein
MPIGVMITPSEAEAARAAEVGSLTGNFFEYDPRETLVMAEKVNATGLEGAHRLVTRMADIYAKHVVKRPTAVPEVKAKVRLQKRVYANK